MKTRSEAESVATEPARHARRSRRKSKEETRVDLLTTAREMLIENGLPVGINMKLTDVLKEKGLTTGAAYHIWDNQRGFQEDLAMFIAEEFAFAGLTVLPPGTIGTADDDPLERVRKVSRAYLDIVRQRHEYYLALQLWGVRDPDEKLQAAIREGYAIVHKDFADAFSASHQANGVRIRDGFTIDDVTVAVTALTEGFVLRQKFDETKLNTEAGDSIYAESMVALYTYFTVKAD